MKRWNAVLLSGLLFAPLAFASGSPTRASVFQARYEGGTLPLKQNHAASVIVAENDVIVLQHGNRLSLPLQHVRQISCSREVQRRFGAAVLDLIPVWRLGNSEEYFVGVSWTGEVAPGKTGTVEAVFRLSAAEYDGFVAALEKHTGKRAVDTSKTPTIVRYVL